MLVIMGAFALMPQIFAAASGFSTLTFACLLVLITWCFLEKKGPNRPDPRAVDLPLTS